MIDCDNGPDFVSLLVSILFDIETRRAFPLPLWLCDLLWLTGCLLADGMQAMAWESTGTFLLVLSPVYHENMPGQDLESDNVWSFVNSPLSARLKSS